MVKKKLYWLILWLSCYSNVVYADENNSQRELFWQARQALQTKNNLQFKQLELHLKDYPLYPYLSYLKLTQQPLAYQNEDEINYFLQTFNNTPLAPKLRAEYLIDIAKKRDWSRFIHYYRPIYGPTLHCYYLNALLATYQKRAAYQAIPELWLSLNSPPSVCRMLFSQWEADGGLTHELIWKKLEQGIQRNDLRLIQHLAQFLSTEEKQQVQVWYQVHHHPLLIAKIQKFDAKNKIDRKILLYGMYRLASNGPGQLVKNWTVLNSVYKLNEAEQQNLFNVLAISLARRADLAADQWLKQIKPAYANSVLREWRVRNQLLKGNWKQVLYWIDQLSVNEQKLPCWRYWRARALAETQQTQAAIDIYKSLAKEVDYYALLASQRLKQTYHPISQRVWGNAIALQQNTAIQRAKELYSLGFIDDARREWQWSLASLSMTQLEAAAQLAKQWQWYDLAIIGAAKASIHNDLKLRFPKAYQPLVLAAAKNGHLSSAWIWAIMRQESAFMWNAKSSAGALGLMQIMPATGKNLAKIINLQHFNLLDPKLNIRLGCTYLKRLLKKFDGNAILATAAYNVGPNRIKNYQALYQRLPSDVWVEILPWKETRDYIKSVSLARIIYNQN